MTEQEVSNLIAWCLYAVAAVLFFLAWRRVR